MASKFYNSEYLKNELILIMSDEADIIEFAKLLEFVKNLGNYSVDKRQSVLSDLVFWKGQLDLQKKQIEIVIKKKEALVYQIVYNKLKIISKPTDAQVRAEMEAMEKDESYLNLQQSLLVCSKWAEILSDLYFIAQSTHKIMGNG